MIIFLLGSDFSTLIVREEVEITTPTNKMTVVWGIPTKSSQVRTFTEHALYHKK